MKTTFTFDGDTLRLRITVQDECEIAMAKLLARFTEATVSLDHGGHGLYDYGSRYDRDRDPKAIDIYLREAPKCPANGQACAKRCDFNDGGTGCKLTPACEPQSLSTTEKP